MSVTRISLGYDGYVLLMFYNLYEGKSRSEFDTELHERLVCLLRCLCWSLTAILCLIKLKVSWMKDWIYISFTLTSMESWIALRVPTQNIGPGGNDNSEKSYFQMQIISLRLRSHLNMLWTMYWKICELLQRETMKWLYHRNISLGKLFLL